MCKGNIIKTVEAVKVTETVADVTEDDQGNFANFKISEKMIKKLEERKVKALFPIQYMTYDHIYKKMDIIAQAKTGTGKTLAFSLPVMCQLQKKEKPLTRGRKPVVLVMAPTRELVNQIAKDFESLIWTKMNVLSIYGGVPYNSQRDALKRGVDIIVGTPGRMRDLVNQGSLDLADIKYVILDEVDRMLDMGFQDIVDEILSYVYPSAEETERNPPQTLLFSATMPKWISNIAGKYLKKDAVKVCLLKGNDSQAASTVEHMALQCPWRDRSAIIADCIRVYGGGPSSRTIVFCERKIDADELAAHKDMSNDCHVLHGDVPQSKREIVLQKFRDGKYNTLVTTNVTARGIDIPDVDLVIQCHPPSDVEDYIHRSGRTGRAGRSGISICFYEQKEKYDLQRIEKTSNFTFKQIKAPNKAAVIGASLNDTIKLFKSIPDSACDVFMNSADTLIAEFGAKKALALALAKIAGKVVEETPKSLLSSMEGFTTYLMTACEPVKFKGYVYTNLKKCLSEEIVETVKRLQFVKGKMGFVFDLPSEHDKTVAKDWVDNDYHQLSKVTILPELEEEMDRNNGGYGGGNRGNGGFGGNRGNGGFKRKFEGSAFGGGQSKVIKFE